MGLDIYTDIIVGRNLKSLRSEDGTYKKALQIFKSLSTDWEDEWDEDFLKDPVTFIKGSDYEELADLTVQVEYDNLAPETTYIGYQLGGGWGKTHEFTDTTEFSKAMSDFEGRTGEKAIIYIMPSMSY